MNENDRLYPNGGSLLPNLPAENSKLRIEVVELKRERDAALLQVEGMRKVVEAAQAVGAEWKRSCTYDTKEVRTMWAALDTLACVTGTRSVGR